MRKITQQNLHSFCRTCLVELTDTTLIDGKYSIQENELEELINVCASMRKDAGLTFPEFVCGICYEKLQSLQEFRCQTMNSLGLLSNICKKLKENNAAPGLNMRDSGQMNEVKLVVGVIKMEDEIYDESREYSNSAKSHDSAITNQCKIDSSNDVPVGDIKMEPSEYMASFDYLDTPKDNINAHNTDEVSPSLYTSTRTPSIYDNVYHHRDDDQSNTVCTNLSKSKKPIKKNRANAQNFICKQCSRRFTNFENYEAHLRTHKGLKPYVCNVCGQGFGRSDRQRTHVREVHSAVMPQYKCSEEGCGKVFNREDTYKKHLRCKHKHQNAKPKTLRQALWHSLFTA